MTQKKICRALTEIKVGEKSLYECNKCYICGITQYPCVARKICTRDYLYSLDDGTYINRRYRATIDEEMLPYCPAWNLPRNKMKELAESRLEMEVKKSTAK